MMMRMICAAGVSAIVLVLAGCEYRNERGPAQERVIGDRPSPVAAQPVATIRMTDDMRFEPETLRVRVGDTVEWRNPSTTPHTVTLDPQRAANARNVEIPTGAEPFDSGPLQAGEVFRHRFDVPGRYRYVCLPHEEEGMMGEVIVEGP